MNDVGPLILPDEKAVFKKLEDKADRVVFQEIFWARRDPNLATPENEFQQQYVKDRATADRRYSVPGRVLAGSWAGAFRAARPVSGSATDCGRLFILFGEPDEIEPAPIRIPAWGLEGALNPSWKAGGLAYRPLDIVSSARVWVYTDRPGRHLQAARVRIAFDQECRGGSNLPRQLDRIAATKILHPNIDYEIDKDGHLVKPADQLAGDTLSRRFSTRP